jgi:hypothetical protein
VTERGLVGVPAGVYLEVYPLEALLDAPVQIWVSILYSPLVVKRRPHRYLSFNPCMQNKKRL